MQVRIHVQPAHERRYRVPAIRLRSYAGNHQAYRTAASKARELPIGDVGHDEDPEVVGPRVE